MTLRFQMPTVLLWGPSGVGKSVAVINALNPDRTAYGAFERGAFVPSLSRELNPWRTEGGKAIYKGLEADGKLALFKHAQELLSTSDPFTEAKKFFVDAAAAAKRGELSSIVCDTISSLCDRLYVYHTAKGVPDGYGKRERAVKSSVVELLSIAMEANLMVVSVAHEQPSTLIEGKFKPAGPKAPGDLVIWLPGQFDMTLRIGISQVDGKNARVVKCDPLNTQQTTRDRYHVVKDGEPLDLRSIIGRAIAKAQAAGG